MRARALCAFRNVGATSAACVILWALAASSAHAQIQPVPPAAESRTGPWAADGVGYGFVTGAHELGFDLEGGFGPPAFTQLHEHDMILGSIHYGWMFGPRWELVGELWGGGQTNSGYGYALGFTPHVRYHFMNHTRWVPFLDGGLGFANTSIRDDDISTEFEFNIQLGAGVEYFLQPNAALVFEYRWFHLSNGGAELPNRGVNVQLLSIGISHYL
jgi:opacity protein-like surface antigen